MLESNVLLAFGLTLFAGLSTGIGSAIAFFTHHTNRRFLAVSLGFSAGVMLYVSLVEILAKGRAALEEPLGSAGAAWVALLAFFGGIGLIALIDRLVPGAENPHESHALEELDAKPDARSGLSRRLLRMGLFTALAIGIHNFPEGLATFLVTLEQPGIGLAIAVAIALHNIPEGIAVSVPIYQATGSRKKAFTYSFLSGLAEPVGALVGYVLLRPFIDDLLFGVLFSGVAGIMVFISLDQLLPTAEKHGEHHLCVYGLMAGMGAMGVSLALFA